jgi:hypothetical protein
MTGIQIFFYYRSGVGATSFIEYNIRPTIFFSLTAVTFDGSAKCDDRPWRLSLNLCNSHSILSYTINVLFTQNPQYSSGTIVVILSL